MGLAVVFVENSLDVRKSAATIASACEITCFTTDNYNDCYETLKEKVNFPSGNMCVIILGGSIQGSHQDHDLLYQHIKALKETGKTVVVSCPLSTHTKLHEDLADIELTKARALVLIVRLHDAIHDHQITDYESTLKLCKQVEKEEKDATTKNFTD